MARKVRCNHGKVVRKRRQQVSPGMGRGAHAVSQDENRTFAGYLDVPGQIAGSNEAR